jgi:Ser/Thr protein kinase RdoA (MazF antagonist)
VHSGDEVARGPASRAKPSRELMQALADQYDIRADDAQDLGGSSNLNLMLTQDQQRWVVRVYRPWTTAARLADIQRVRQHLLRGGVPCAPPLDTRDGRGWIEVGDRLVEVEPYVEHDAKMDSWERLAVGLPLLGQLHSLLEAFSVSPAGRQAPAANAIAPEDLVPGVLRGTRRLQAWGPTPAELELGKTAELLAHRVQQVERSFAELPRQLVHGDYWDKNVLFREGGIVLVADLDFMGQRARVDDLALTLYYTQSTFAEDRLSDNRVGRLRVLVEAYDSGLNRPLATTERASLPSAIVRTALGFVAMMAAVETTAGARQLAAEMLPDIAWARAIVEDLSRWQAAFI